MKKLPKRLTSLPLPDDQLAEVNLWAATAHTDADASRRPPASATSVRNYIRMYGYTLHCAELLFGLSRNQRPGEIWTPERIDTLVQVLRKHGHAAATIKVYLISIDRMMAALSPAADWIYINRVISRIPGSQFDAGRAGRLRDTAELIELGNELMDNASQSHNEPDGIAYDYMIGLIVAVLAQRPMREALFRGLLWLPEAEKSGVRSEAYITASGPHFTIVTPPPAPRMKKLDGKWRRGARRLSGGKNPPKTKPAPAALNERLRAWFEIHRPALAIKATETNHVWLARSGNPISKSQLLKEVQRAIATKFGEPMTIQDFRSSYARSERRASPEKASQAYRQLGHNQTMTHEQYLPPDPVLTRAIGSEIQWVIDAIVDGRDPRKQPGPDVTVMA